MSSKSTPRQRRGALGKGMGSLLGSESEDEALETTAANTREEGTVLELDPNAIKANPKQPRKTFHDKKLKELTESIKQDGVLQPLVVFQQGPKGDFYLIAGERRLRASRLAGLKKVPVIVKSVGNEEMLRLALIENIQRDDLSPIDEAKAYKSLVEDFDITQEECARKVGKERSTISNIMRLLSLPQEIQQDIEESKLTQGHGRCLLTLEDKRLMLRVRDIVVKKKLNVRQTEQLCKSTVKGKSQNQEGLNLPNNDLNYIADNLRQRLKTKVKLSGTGTRGRIEISYFSATELERIIEVIKP